MPGKDAPAFNAIEALDKAFSICPEVKTIIVQNDDMEIARDKLFELSYNFERKIEVEDSDIHPLERVNIKNALIVFRNFLSKRNERISGHSLLKTLFNAIRKNEQTLSEISENLTQELLHLFKAMKGLSGMYSPDGKKRQDLEPEYQRLKGREAAIARSRFLDELSNYSERFISRYHSGLEEEIVKKREENVRRILERFKADEDDWNNYQWHLSNIIRDAETLGSIIDMTPEEKEAITKAENQHIPFGITPYYASLMDKSPERKMDHAIRAQVIPPMSYVDKFSQANRMEMDFMLERDTSPIDLVTRRYPMIAIVKPYNTCAQICVYCQRNWEIDEVYSRHALASPQKIDAAVEWFKQHPSIKAVLITGGDPLILPDETIDDLLRKFSSIPHIERIRIGTRTPVVLPFRFTMSLVKILKKYHVPGKRELALVTHFEHPYEVTPDSLRAVQLVKENTSINFYNQQVFTIENSRKFETVALRRAIKFIGVDPYYIFHAKGKKETEYYIVPIARLLQERKEEARLSPGLVRTDEPVYNIPGVGKNHLRAMQDHELIMLTPNGNRIYEMHPWEKAIVSSKTYIYEDVPIWEYLLRLKARGENIEDYKTIWYYY